MLRQLLRLWGRTRRLRRANARATAILDRVRARREAVEAELLAAGPAGLSLETRHRLRGMLARNEADLDAAEAALELARRP
jgi:multidrug resistance efflux pump